MATKSTNALTRIHLHQALYGYRRGHEQLACSVALRPESRAALLVLTDMSGPSLIPGFESYLTGVPLPDDGLYAFARTWYAPEMSRPGCVWTHVILIKMEDLTGIDRLEDLATLFRRPERDDWSYEHTLALDEASEYEVPRALPEDAERLLNGFYASSGPVILTASSPEENESLILSLWSLQGPKSRFSFSFCTGSMSNRKHNGASLTIQAIPVEVRRQIEREPGEISLLERQPDRTNQSWAGALAREMSSRDFGPLTRLVRSADLHGESRLLLPGILIISSDGPTRNVAEAINRLVKEIALRWPSPDLGREIKREFLGGTAKLKAILSDAINEADILHSLSACAMPSAFDSKKLEIRERSASLWTSDKSAARSLTFELLHGGGNELGDEILSGLMESAPDSELWALAERNSALVLSLLRRDSSLAESPRLWKLPKIRAADVLDAIGQTSLSRISGIMSASLEAERFDVSRQLLERGGSRSAQAAIDSILAHTESGGYPIDFLRALGKHHELILKALRSDNQKSSASIILLSCLEMEHARNLSPDTLLLILRSSPEWLATNIGRVACATALARGLSASDGQGLVAETLTPVHRALAEGELDYEGWKPLERIVPSIGWRNWDKCERLRRALIESIGLHSWPASLIFSAAKDENVLRLVARTCRANSNGRSLLQKAIKDYAAMNRLTPALKKILRNDDDLADYD